MVWRDARWIMDCLQCVRSKQWVGAVPLGLVMGGDPPPCPDGEEEESLTVRLSWPHRLAQRAITGTAVMLVYTCSTEYTKTLFNMNLITYLHNFKIC